MKVTRQGETFDVNPFPDDDWGFWDRFADGRWEPESFDILDAYLTPESTFVDIGAWVGPLTLWASRRCARVVAVEPDPVAFSILSENTHSSDRVTLVDAAISNEHGLGMLQSRDHDGPADAFGNSMSGLNNAAATGCAVETLTIGDLWARCGLDLQPPALVKIDIEGGEARLIDAAPFLRQFPLLLSLHGPWMSTEDQQAVSAAFDVDATTFSSVLVLP